MNCMKNVIDALKAERIAKGWTTRGLAKRLGVSQAAISAWERGTREPAWEDLERWAMELGGKLKMTVATEHEPPSLAEEAALLVSGFDPSTAELVVAQLRAAASLKRT